MARSSSRSLFLVVLVILVCGALGMVYGQRQATVTATSDAEIRESLRVFSQVYDVVEQNYAEPVNAD